MNYFFSADSEVLHPSNILSLIPPLIIISTIIMVCSVPPHSRSPGSRPAVAFLCEFRMFTHHLTIFLHA